MSYSIHITATSKADAITQVTAELASTLKAQPAHSCDHAQALAAVTSFIGIMAEPTTGKSLSVSISGSVGGFFGDTDVGSSFVPSTVGVSIGIGEITTPAVKSA